MNGHGALLGEYPSHRGGNPRRPARGSQSLGIVRDGRNTWRLSAPNTSHKAGDDDVERPVNLPREGPHHPLLAATRQRCGARMLLSSRRGPGVNTERPEPEG